MSHLSFEVIYRLAGLVTWDMGFEEQDAKNMMHMKSCERCYRQFCATMRMMDALDDFGFVEKQRSAGQQTHRKIAAQRKNTARVEIGMTVDCFCTELEVLSASGGWSFVRPASVNASAGVVMLCPPTRLEDLDDTRTYLEVDPEDGRLHIRLALGCFGQNPQVWLIDPAGEKTPVPLTDCAKSLEAKLPAMPSGKYRLLLEK